MKEDFEMPYSCDECDKVFDIQPFLKKEDAKRIIGEVLKERFGDRVLCEGCRKN